MSFLSTATRQKQVFCRLFEAFWAIEGETVIATREISLSKEKRAIGRSGGLCKYFPIICRFFKKFSKFFLIYFVFCVILHSTFTGLIVCCAYLLMCTVSPIGGKGGMGIWYLLPGCPVGRGVLFN